EGGREKFVWENQSWDFSNSDNSGGSDEKSGEKLPLSRFDAQTETRAEAEAKEKKRGGGGVGVGNNEKGSEEVEGGNVEGESDHEIHIWTERERRKKMRNMFANLHALLPHLPPKADKSTIVDEAVNYIKTLQHTLQKLQKQKLERLQGATQPSIFTPPKLPFNSREAFLADQGSSSSNLAINANLSVSQYPVLFQTWTASNVILNTCGDEAQISVCSPKNPCLLTTVCHILEKHNIEVISAHVSSDCNRSMYMIQARVS
ncbi:HLH domain-containing protein, partial [Cephalotus follicularis]